MAQVFGVADEPESIAITKAQQYFYDAVIKMMSPEDLATARGVVLKRLQDEEAARIAAKAEAELKAMGLDDWMNSLNAPVSDEQQQDNAEGKA